VWEAWKEGRLLLFHTSTLVGVRPIRFTSESVLSWRLFTVTRYVTVKLSLVLNYALRHGIAWRHGGMEVQVNIFLTMATVVPNRCSKWLNAAKWKDWEKSGETSVRLRWDSSRLAPKYKSTTSQGQHVLRGGGGSRGRFGASGVIHSAGRL
jgi:hypothetical protein